MLKSSGFLRAIIVAGLVVPLSVSAFASRRVHRPWLLVGAKRTHARRSTRVVAERPSDSSSDKLSLPAPAAQTPIQPVVVGPAAPETWGDRIAEQAARYEGTRYKFGGTNKKGIDCSGLVMRVFEDLKMKRLPHASSALYSAGSPVQMSDLRPGDLVFFRDTYRSGISHVGVYAGHNKFVHAANHKTGVIMTALSDPYYQLHYAGARRLY